MKRLIFLIPIILITAGAIFLSFTHKDSSGGKTVKIVSAENFWGNITAQIAGNNAEISSIISSPTQDPHSYETTISDARNISNSDIIIKNGAGYDAFMDKITSVGRLNIINVSDIAGINSSDNPHIWYDLDYVKAFAGKMESLLSETDSSNSSVYSSNYQTFLTSLEPIETVCNEIKFNYAGTKVIATERVFDYMLQTCGLQIIPNDLQKAIEEGNDPSITAVNSFEYALNTHEAKVLIYNTQTTDPATIEMQKIAVKDGIPVVGITETMPANETYQTWIFSEISNLYKALKQNG